MGIFGLFPKQRLRHSNRRQGSGRRSETVLNVFKGGCKSAVNGE
jgi:hypothetical protein